MVHRSDRHFLFIQTRRRKPVRSAHVKMRVSASEKGKLKKKKKKKKKKERELTLTCLCHCLRSRILSALVLPSISLLTSPSCQRP